MADSSGVERPDEIVMLGRWAMVPWAYVDERQAQQYREAGWEVEQFVPLASRELVEAERDRLKEVATHLAAALEWAKCACESSADPDVSRQAIAHYRAALASLEGETGRDYSPAMQAKFEKWKARHEVRR